MRSEKSLSKVFNRRMALIAGGKVAFLGALAGRLYYLQVVESDRYRMLADENRINLVLLPPPRGFIVDRNGAALAVNTQNYRVVIVPEQTRDISTTLIALGKLIALSANDVSARRTRRTAASSLRSNYGTRQFELGGSESRRGKRAKPCWGQYRCWTIPILSTSANPCPRAWICRGCVE